MVSHRCTGCQHQPASISLAFELSGNAGLVEWGLGCSLLKLGTCNKRGHYISLPSPPVALSFHTSTGSLDPFYQMLHVVNFKALPQIRQ